MLRCVLSLGIGALDDTTGAWRAERFGSPSWCFRRGGWRQCDRSLPDSWMTVRVNRMIAQCQDHEDRAHSSSSSLVKSSMTPDSRGRTFFFTSSTSLHRSSRERQADQLVPRTHLSPSSSLSGTVSFSSLLLCLRVGRRGRVALADVPLASGSPELKTKDDEFRSGLRAPSINKSQM
jgi:hypothetical protein